MNHPKNRTTRRGLFRPPLNQGPDFRDRFEAYVSLQKVSLAASFNRIWETPVASSLTIFVVAIALALPASFSALIENARQPLEALDTSSQVSLFIRPDLSDERARKLATTLAADPRLDRATLLTKAEGLQELKGFSGFEEALSALTSNPLPAVILLRPKKTDAAAVSQLLESLKALPEADRVQFDDEWLQKLRALMAIVERAVAAFSLLLGFGVLFIVGNTIRLELQHRREEIIVHQMLGATRGFIRRPFIHSGFWYGFLGALLALFLANLLILGIKHPADELAALYESPYRLSLLSLHATLTLLASAIFLGMSGAWIVVNRFLREIEPA